MPKVSVHDNQITRPNELRDALTTEADDAPDAEELVDRILLKARLRRAANRA
jgi:hypothetical protein